MSSTEMRQWRRKRAWDLKQQGWKQRDIAHAPGVSEGAVSQWLKQAREVVTIRLFALAAFEWGRSRVAVTKIEQ